MQSKDKIISDLQTQIASFKRGNKPNLSNVQSKLAQIEKQKTLLFQRRNAARRQNQIKIQEYRSQQNNYRLKESQLNTQLQSKEQKFQQLKQQNQVKISQISHIGQQINRLVTQKKHLTQQLKAGRGKLSKTKDQTQKLIKQQFELAKQQQTVSLLNDGNMSHLQQVMTDKQTIQNLIAKAKQQCNQKSRHIDNYKDSLQVKQQNYKDQLAQIKLLQQEINYIQQILSCNTKQINKYQRVITGQKQKHDKKAQIMAQLSLSLQHLQQTAASSQQNQIQTQNQLKSNQTSFIEDKQKLHRLTKLAQVLKDSNKVMIRYLQRFSQDDQKVQRIFKRKNKVKQLRDKVTQKPKTYQPMTIPISRRKQTQISRKMQMLRQQAQSQYDSLFQKDKEVDKQKTPIRVVYGGNDALKDKQRVQQLRRNRAARQYRPK